MCCVKVGTPRSSADGMYCSGKVMVVDAYQSTTSVCSGYAGCLFAWPSSISVPQSENGGYCPPSKMKWIPMSGGGDELGIREYRVEVVFRYLMPHCVRRTVCHNADLH